MKQPLRPTILRFDSLPSTNTEAARQAVRGAPEGLCIIAREQTRARYPDESGFVEREGVRTYYEVYGDGEPTVLLLPTWSLVHSRHWRMQISYLARHFRVLVMDGLGIVAQTAASIRGATAPGSSHATA